MHELCNHHIIAMQSQNFTKNNMDLFHNLFTLIASCFTWIYTIFLSHHSYYHLHSSITINIFYQLHVSVVEESTIGSLLLLLVSCFSSKSYGSDLVSKEKIQGLLLALYEVHTIDHSKIGIIE